MTDRELREKKRQEHDSWHNSEIREFVAWMHDWEEDNLEKSEKENENEIYM